MRIFSLIPFLFILLQLSLPAQDINQTDDQGLKQGKWVKTYQNGATRYEGQFRNNKPYGQFKYYSEYSNLEAVTNFSDDGVIAYTETFHENGQPMAKGKYINQKKDSTWLFFSDVDGALVAKENYKNGVLDGESITYYPESETLAEVIIYKNGLKHGPYFKYFPNGEIMVQGSFKDDMPNGLFEVFYPGGKPEIRGEYQNGNKIGDWDYFAEDGTKMSEEEFKEQEEVKKIKEE